MKLQGGLQNMTHIDYLSPKLMLVPSVSSPELELRHMNEAKIALLGHKRSPRDSQTCAHTSMDNGRIRRSQSLNSPNNTPLNSTILEFFFFFFFFFVYSVHKPYEGRGKTVADIRHAGQTEGCRGHRSSCADEVCIAHPTSGLGVPATHTHQ